MSGLTESSSLDLSGLDWTLTGWRPHAWRLRRGSGAAGFLEPDHGPYAARLPGSVQANLLRVGAIPDWLVGRNSLAIEWVEHRHWMFATRIDIGPVVPEERVIFSAAALDYSGWLLIDGRTVAEFRGPHCPTEIDVSHELAGPGPHEFALVFDSPPEEQGQLGYTSRARHFKPRYSFGWDWCVRMVSIGAVGRLALERRLRPAVALLSVGSRVADDLSSAEVFVRLAFDESESAGTVVVRTTLSREGASIITATESLSAGENRLTLRVEHPELWWPNGLGAQPLYRLEVDVFRRSGGTDRWQRELGFKHVAWRGCDGAPADALSWLCVVNGRPVFLQGVNWTPVRLCPHDVEPEEIERLVTLYRDLGCNLLRVWGGAGREAPAFYAACDRAGLLVWQEFPLSSSGIDSVPPDDNAFLAELSAIARHFIRSLQHHACLLQWCGGNELHHTFAATDGGLRVPLLPSHPALQALAEVVAAEDSQHRFLPTSPFGPRFHSTAPEFGRGLHHNVHGPWGLSGFPTRAEWIAYWKNDDALFRAETGVAGASALATIRRHAGAEPVWPPTNSLWQHSAGWWSQWERLGKEFDGLSFEAALEKYVELTQREQAECLAIAAEATKARFPRCGGFLVWMGHDAFPCPINTSLIDHAGIPKPAAYALRDVFLAPGPDEPVHSLTAQN